MIARIHWKMLRVHLMACRCIMCGVAPCDMNAHDMSVMPFRFMTPLMKRHGKQHRYALPSPNMQRARAAVPAPQRRWALGMRWGGFRAPLQGVHAGHGSLLDSMLLNAGQHAAWFKL